MLQQSLVLSAMMELSTSTPLSQPSDKNAVDTNKVYDMSLYSYLILNVNFLGCHVKPWASSVSLRCLRSLRCVN